MKQQSMLRERRQPYALVPICGRKETQIGVEGNVRKSVENRFVRGMNGVYQKKVPKGIVAYEHNSWRYDTNAFGILFVRGNLTTES